MINLFLFEHRKIQIIQKFEPMELNMNFIFRTTPMLVVGLSIGVNGVNASFDEIE